MAMMAMREVEKIVCNADFLSQDVGLEASWPRSMRSSRHDPKQGQTGTEGRTSHRCKYVVDGAKLFPVQGSAREATQPRVEAEAHARKPSFGLS